MEQINLERISKWVVENYDSLPKSTVTTGNNKKELIIIAVGDFSGEYGFGSTDLESWGIDKDGRIFWAFASGCSCYTNTSIEEKTMKIFEVKEVINSLETNIVERLILFEADVEEFKKQLESYEYSSC